ncbi:MAG: hypothetical protein A2293_00060 [Elusimicrobia bacterium RIFOXYB2_FULL_49_7]|nr:MAG: hypothetical protein A2293_00060 [Elusimicrobia bacterium RIFOXYB2_FULL_49_7]
MNWSLPSFDPDSRWGRILRGLLFVCATLLIGRFIALKIYHVPSRTDILIFCTLVSCIPVLKFPRFGVFYLFIVPPLLPFVRRFYYTFYDRPDQDLFHIIPDMVVLLLTFVFLDRLRKHADLAVEDKPLLKALWIFIGYQFLRSLVGNYLPALEGLSQFKFAVLYMMCFFFAFTFIDNKEQVRSLFRLTVVLGVLVGLYGIKQTFFGFTDFELIWLKYMKDKFVTLFISGVPRPFSTLSSPACFADFMMIAILAAFCMILLSSGTVRLFYVLTVPVMFYALLLTSVRTNWMGLIVGVIFWFIIAHRASLKRKVVLMTFLVAVSFAMNTLLDLSFSPGDIKLMSFEQTEKTLLTPGGQQNITDIFVKERLSAIADPLEEHSMVSRFAMWKMVLQHSVWLPMGPFGWGLGTFNAHNYYLTILYEIGYPGLFLLLFILYRIFRQGFRVYKEEEERDKRVLVRGMLAILFMIAFINTTGTHISSHPADIYFWFFAGLLMIIRRLKSGTDAGRFVSTSVFRDPT